MLKAPPLALYVHLPWCVQKCPYCDFNSHPAPRALPSTAYVDALLADLDTELTRIDGRAIVSVFLGGGTPSLFAPGDIERLLDGIRARVACAPDAEITMEANPGAIERGSFAGYRAAGVTRISLGAQSFDDGSLSALGRVHRASETELAVMELREAGITDFNLDLMFALPEQTCSAALADVERALALDPSHVSHYQLTLEPGTAFHRRPPRLPDQDAAWEMQRACEERLTDAGFARYEVSAYARPGRRSRHNLNYWRFGDYIGIGAGAHGKRTDPAGQRIVRSMRLARPRSYLGAAPAGRVEAEWEVAAEARAFEFMLNALRLYEGFAAADFEACTGLAFESIEEPISCAQAKGLLERTPGQRWCATDFGMRFLNDLQALFLH